MARQLPPWLIELQENRPQLFQDLPEYGSEEFKESGLGARFKGKFGNRQYKAFTDNIVNQRQAVIDAARPKRSEITTDVRGEDFTKIPTFNRERTVTERVGRGSFKNIPEWRGPDGEWSRFDPIIDRSYSADDDARNIDVYKQLNTYEESNRSQALANAERKRLGSQGDGNTTSSWSVQGLQGILNTNFTKEQIENTTNDVTAAGFKIGSFDNNTQETTKKSTINESPARNSVRQNKQLLGSMDQLTLEATDYGANPDRAPLKSIKNPSGETNPIQDSKSSGANVWKPEGLFDTKNIESMPDFKESIKMGEKLKLSEGSGMNMDKINALLSVAKELGIGQSKKKEGTGKPMDTNVNIDQIASSNLDPWLNFYQV